MQYEIRIFWKSLYILFLLNFVLGRGTHVLIDAGDKLKLEQEIQQTLTDEDCCLEDCGEPGTKPTFCPSPFSKYTITVPEGRDTHCPDTEAQFNCKGLSLTNLQAIHLYASYYFEEEW